MDKPRVGIGVFILKNNKILMGKRKGSHGAGTWCIPGGSLDFGETIIHCAKREVLEETGLRIKNIRLGPFTNDIFKNEGKHFLSIYVVADYTSGIPKIMEPEKCDGWEWFEWDEMPKPLCLPNKNLLKTGYNPFKA